jgi:hypothetical protein
VVLAGAALGVPDAVLAYLILLALGLADDEGAAALILGFIGLVFGQREDLLLDGKLKTNLPILADPRRPGSS